MALSKRNSRPITIDEVEFRWAVSSRSQGATDLVTVVIQPPNDGCRLEVAVPCRDPYLHINSSSPPVAGDVRSITPNYVRRLIELARSLGWQADSVDTPFTVSCVQAEEKSKLGETCHAIWRCPDCDENYSEDIDFGDKSPIIASCGRTKNHPRGQITNVILFW